MQENKSELKMTQPESSPVFDITRTAPKTNQIRDQELWSMERRIGKFELLPNLDKLEPLSIPSLALYKENRFSFWMLNNSSFSLTKTMRSVSELTNHFLSCIPKLKAHFAVNPKRSKFPKPTLSEKAYNRNRRLGIIVEFLVNLELMSFTSPSHILVDPVQALQMPCGIRFLKCPCGKLEITSN
jgi:hypothetical protein